MGATGMNFSVPEYGLAEYLSSLGYDCFVADLRGDPETEAPAGKGRFDFNLDDHVQHDMPALVAAVQQSTGSERMHMVGHSMGGVIIGSYMSFFGDEPVQSAVIVASPFRFRNNPDIYLFGAEHIKTIHRLPTFPVASSQKTLGRLLGAFDLWIEVFLYNPDNMDAKRLLAFSQGGLAATPAKVLAQFADNMRDNSNRTWDRSFDYTANLSRISAPSLWIAGKADEICQPVNVRLGYEVAGGSDKQYFLAGRSNGFKVDYGHGDLLLGVYTADEIFPLIEVFLAEHQP